MSQQQIELRKGKHQKFTELLEFYRGSITNALPSVVTPDRMIRSVLSAITREPKLLDCTEDSFAGAVLVCAQLGLMCDGVTGEAFLLAQKNRKTKRDECTYFIGYKGLCTLAYRSGMVSSIQARAVHEGDEFEYELGLHEKLRHIPAGCTDDAKITHFYSIIKMVNGGHSMNVMTVEAVNKVRDESDNYTSATEKADTIWHKKYADMGCKTVLRSNMKYTPFSTEVSKAIALDELADVGKQNLRLEMLGDFHTSDEMKTASIQADEAVNLQQKKKDQKAAIEDLATKAQNQAAALLSKKKSTKK